jgi:predicted GH43/DUF377 family glycosyl hydrolase
MFDEVAGLFRRCGPILSADRNDVIIKRFFPSSLEVGRRIAKETLRLPEEAVQQYVESIHRGWGGRHNNLGDFLTRRFDEVAPRLDLPAGFTPSASLKQLIASYFVHEYAVQSAALFNPSMVPHPEQPTDIASDGRLRVIISLRATGEGHISSVVFREGVLSPSGEVSLKPISKVPLDGGSVTSDESGASSFYFNPITGHEFVVDAEEYTIQFPASVPLDRRVLFPCVRCQSNGVEDARFVRFEGGAFYGTFTAYDGQSIRPQLVETADFETFRVRKITGAIKNKGMALFPRKIQGKYWMLSRQDDVNVLCMHSDSLFHWENPQVLLRPQEPWEMFKMGNCGSPIETPKGWLVLTHGVGPMRRYCLGVAMLDLNDPTKVIGRMKSPLIAPNEAEREGYVPNVVYACGALLHNNTLVIPYATSDSMSSFGTVSLTDLYSALGL